MVWRERLELPIKARGLFAHLDRTMVRSDDPLTRPVGSKTLTVEEVTLGNASIHHYAQIYIIVHGM